MNYRSSDKAARDINSISGGTVVPPGGTLRAAWRLVYPFWMSEHRWKAYGLIAVMVAEILFGTSVNVWFNGWNGRFMDALVHYDAHAIWPLLFRLCGIMASFVVMAIVNLLASSTLIIMWRQWLTHRFVDQWLARDEFYRIERDQSVDNPDQRITVDIAMFVTHTQSLVLGFIRTVVSLCAFIGILWKLSGPTDFSVFGINWHIPAYMVWVAFAYTLLSSWIVHMVGRRLMPLTFQQERAEADFRFMMAGVREYAEQVALYHGSNAESRRMKMGFEAVRGNFWQIVRFRLRFEPVNIILTYISLLFPTFVSLPRYLRHAISFGDMTRLTGAFSQVHSGLSWFIQNYQLLQQYRVIVARLAVLQSQTGTEDDRSIGARCGSANIEHVTGLFPTLRVEQLALCTPEGRSLAKPVSFEVMPGERWLIRGNSGVGKSTLMRALAGIWPYGTGIVSLPEHSRLLFLSQKNYVPPGTLKDALCYPATADRFDLPTCKRVLQDCRLGHYVISLHDTDRWGQRLSPGEQQRLAFARVLLHRPDYVFMDESTSAVDPDTERHLYETVIRQLPASALISISHHAAVGQFHTHTLELLAVSSVADDSPVTCLPDCDMATTAIDR